MQMEEQDVNEQLLQLEFLKALGINLLDSTLAASAECIRILPQMTRMALVRCSQLYDMSEHKNCPLLMLGTN
jgi:hypothetical protein